MNLLKKGYTIRGPRSVNRLLVLLYPLGRNKKATLPVQDWPRDNAVKYPRGGKCTDDIHKDHQYGC